MEKIPHCTFEGNGKRKSILSFVLYHFIPISLIKFVVNFYKIIYNLNKIIYIIGKLCRLRCLRKVYSLIKATKAHLTCLILTHANISS